MHCCEAIMDTVGAILPAQSVPEISVQPLQDVGRLMKCLGRMLDSQGKRQFTEFGERNGPTFDLLKDNINAEHLQSKDILPATATCAASDTFTLCLGSCTPLF